MKKAIFLDRDGVINHDSGYTYKIDEFQFIKGVFDACEYFLHHNYLLFIITNQSGIGRGFYTLNDFEKLTLWMNAEFFKRGITITKVYFCPHTPEENCFCRKPNPGMIQEAVYEFNLDLQHSWMIGDKESDIEAALGAGLNQTILITNGERRNSKSSFQVNNLFESTKIIKNSEAMQ